MKAMYLRLHFAVLLAFSATPGWAQDHGNPQEGTPAGGKWLRSDEIDGPTSAKVVTFTLPAAEAELGRSPYIELVCTGTGKLVRARYFADTVISPNAKDYLHYNAPSLSPKVQFDKRSKFSPIWEIYADNRSALLDKRTIREILRSNEVYVRYLDKATAHLEDVYLAEGLDTNALERACGNNGWLDK